MRPLPLAATSFTFIIHVNEPSFTPINVTNLDHCRIGRQSSELLLCVCHLSSLALSWLAQPAPWLLSILVDDHKLLIRWPPAL
jgi:hypothetical protein